MGQRRFFLLAMTYFAIFLIAGIVLGKEYDYAIRFPVFAGMIATLMYFYTNYVDKR